MGDADAAAGPPVGWIGLGRMGSPMARRLREAGHPLRLWARRPEALADWRGLPGVQCVDVLPALVEGCAVIVTMVAGPDDVQGLQSQLMPMAAPGTLFLDLTTADPQTAGTSARLAAAHGLATVDAPVTGGVAGARQGTLTAFAGGAREDLTRAEPVLRAFCGRIVPCGGGGSGYRTKLINQTLVAGTLLGVADAARMARVAGLDAAWLQDVLAGGTAQSALLQAYLGRMMAGDGAASFTLGLMLKDLRLARGACAELGVPAPLLDAAIATVNAGVQRHGEHAGLQALAW